MLISNVDVNVLTVDEAFGDLLHLEPRLGHRVRYRAMRHILSFVSWHGTPNLDVSPCTLDVHPPSATPTF